MEMHFLLVVPAETSPLAQGLGLKPWRVTYDDSPDIYIMPKAPLLANVLAFAEGPAVLAVPCVGQPDTDADYVRLMAADQMPANGESLWWI